MAAAYLSTSTRAKIVEFERKFPLPKVTYVIESQMWTHRLCEQLKYSFPNDGWGHKSAGPGRPHSADCIALQSPFIGWDIIYDSASPNAQLQLTTPSIDLTGQLFEPVSAYNHLQDVVEPPIPPPVDDTIDAKLNLILKGQVELAERMNSQYESLMAAIRADRITKIM